MISIYFLLILLSAFIINMKSDYDDLIVIYLFFINYALHSSSNMRSCYRYLIVFAKSICKGCKGSYYNSAALLPDSSYYSESNLNPLLLTFLYDGRTLKMIFR